MSRPFFAATAAARAPAIDICIAQAWMSHCNLLRGLARRRGWRSRGRTAQSLAYALKMFAISPLGMKLQGWMSTKDAMDLAEHHGGWRLSRSYFYQMCSVLKGLGILNREGGKVRWSGLHGAAPGPSPINRTAIHRRKPALKPVCPRIHPPAPLNMRFRGANGRFYANKPQPEAQMAAPRAAAEKAVNVQALLPPASGRPSGPTPPASAPLSLTAPREKQPEASTIPPEFLEMLESLDLSPEQRAQYLAARARNDSGPANQLAKIRPPSATELIDGMAFPRSLLLKAGVTAQDARLADIRLRGRLSAADNPIGLLLRFCRSLRGGLYRNNAELVEDVRARW